MKTPILKRFKLSSEKLLALNPIGKKLLEELAYESEEGLKMIRMGEEDAVEVRVIINPVECIKMLELEEMRDDEI